MLCRFNEIYSLESWNGWKKKDTCVEMMMLAAIHPSDGWYSASASAAMLLVSCWSENTQPIFSPNYNFGRNVFNNIIHCKYERSSLPLQGCPLFSAAWSVHEYFLLFPEPSDTWHHSSATFCSIEWIKGNLYHIDKSKDRNDNITLWKKEENHTVKYSFKWMQKNYWYSAD